MAGKKKQFGEEIELLLGPWESCFTQMGTALFSCVTCHWGSATEDPPSGSEECVTQASAPVNQLCFVAYKE